MRTSSITGLCRAAVLCAAAIGTSAAQAQDLPKTEFTYVGTWGNLTLYNKVEKPFWGDTISEKSGGAITVKVQPFTELGLKGDEILRLLRNGVLDMSATLLSYVGGDIPEAEAVDLAGITRDIDEAHRISDAYKPVLAEVFEKEYGVKLLAIIPYHAQISYCNAPIDSLEDFKGLKVRTSGRSQSDMIEALGGTPVGMPFGEVVPALEKGVVDCAIAGALSGNLAKWQQATTNLYPLPISWAITFVAANLDFWNGLDPEVRALLEKEIGPWEDSAWESGRSETAEGIACNTGGECVGGNVAHMTLSKIPEGDYEKLRTIMQDVVIPKWAERCGSECAARWNETAGAAIGLSAPTE
ncbi:TRAP transporter substrate-binding protein [Frigidibacter sp. ROC022]|uniref:TRAP transporter substrate-binding protein n=1 Tax=Frigidibacter sp. ROC022 TaxID=2971796 RepID=UPI00215AB6DF|nr:TRAP transporter substrate-binding protein [Frigidibacter sp. ROC022]MCR8725889.1 TRAP transporter substrate-binding protein [Frigidibacter sp. ROC022]